MIIRTIRNNTLRLTKEDMVVINPQLQKYNPLNPLMSEESMSVKEMIQMNSRIHPVNWNRV